MIITIHQPEFMPYLGFFHKMEIADKMVLLDNVQFKKNNFQNRNRLNINQNANWLTMPTLNHQLATNINEIKINYSITNIIKKHLNTISFNYCKSDFYEDLFPEIEKVYNNKYEFLSDFNTDIILLLKKKLGIETEIIKSSELNLSGKAKGGTFVTLEISEVLNAKTYISGSGGKNYMDINEFSNKNINVYFQHYNHPKYLQYKTLEFIPYLSTIDLYFNHGKKSLEILKTGNIQKSDIEKC